MSDVGSASYVKPPDEFVVPLWVTPASSDTDHETPANGTPSSVVMLPSTVVGSTRIGVTGSDAADATEVPAVLVAVTVNV